MKRPSTTHSSTIARTIIALIYLIGFQTFSQSKTIDEIVFGNPASEKRHSFTDKASQIISGGMNEPARQLLPIEGERVEGGYITFTMKVDPDKQNYFTTRFWGSDSGNENILILFIEGKQVGYRHLGDYDMLNIANNDAPFLNRFIYTTLPLPLHITKGKKEVELSIRSTGWIFRYGETFDQYQKPMTKTTKGIYKAYTHTDGYFVPSKKEKQGKEPQRIVRPAPGEEVIAQVKEHVNNIISGMLQKKRLTQDEVSFLTDAYLISWTKAYKQKAVIDKAIETADSYYRLFSEKPEIVYKDAWITTGPIARAVYVFAPEIRKVLDETMFNGKTRRENWSAMFTASVNYAKTHRRSYTNQSMIVDLFLQHVNRAIAIVNYQNALPAFQTYRYLYESMGLAPWLGSETANGPQKPLGDSYYQLTKKGLTKELGFVGGYGEIVHWMNHIYNATGEQGTPDSRDASIREQMLKMFKARCFFRYPSFDNDGYSTMRGEAVIGWRDHGYYPANILYGEKGYTREASPITVTASTLDPEAVSYAQQMMDDNQFFAVVKEKMNDRGLNSTHSLLRVPDDYELIKRQPHYTKKLPMSKGMPDVVFSDEEVGVVAIKNGEEIFYASLYWRANFAINFLARIHYITPQTDRVATVFEDIKFTDSGMRYTRPERVNLYFSDARNFYPEVKSAHTGEVLPIAKIPEGIKFTPGQENIYAGKGDFYTLRYGKYLIGMNCTKDRHFDLNIPRSGKVSVLPSKRSVKEEVISVPPMSTTVLLIE